MSAALPFPYPAYISQTSYPHVHLSQIEIHTLHPDPFPLTLSIPTQNSCLRHTAMCALLL